MIQEGQAGVVLTFGKYDYTAVLVLTGAYRSLFSPLRLLICLQFALWRSVVRF